MISRCVSGCSGEVTLTGRVLPVGGVKEKTLAARRSGVTTLLLPRDNVSEWEELAGRHTAISFSGVEAVRLAFFANGALHGTCTMLMSAVQCLYMKRTQRPLKCWDCGKNMLLQQLHQLFRGLFLSSGH